MIKIKTTQYYVRDRFENHSEIKLRLLDLIETSYTGGYEYKDAQESTKISRYDFREHNDWERPWAKFLLPYIEPKLNSLVNELGGSDILLKALWFQQYEPGDIHDWHIHGENYTGVYYLELPDGAPVTKIYDGEHMFTPKVKEGDLCIFPAMAPHIGMQNESLSTRKTIISYNFNVKGMTADVLENMKNNLV